MIIQILRVVYIYFFYLVFNRIDGKNSSKSIASKIRVLILRPLFRKIGENVNLQAHLRFEGLHNISIGENSGLGRNCSISAIAPITIGDNVMIAEDVIIKTSNHSISRIENMMDLPVNSKAISIGNNVWIGARVIILAGVTIGDNVVIAAGAVVSKSFGSNCVIGGVPARIIKEIE